MAAAAGTGSVQSPSHRKRTRAQRSFTAEDAQVIAPASALSNLSRGTTVSHIHFTSGRSMWPCVAPPSSSAAVGFPYGKLAVPVLLLGSCMRALVSIVSLEATRGAHASRRPVQVGGYGTVGWHGQGNACFESLDAGGKLEAAKQAATAIEDAYARYRQRQTARDLRRFQLSSMCAVLVTPLLMVTQDLCFLQSSPILGCMGYASVSLFASCSAGSHEPASTYSCMSGYYLAD